MGSYNQVSSQWRPRDHQTIFVVANGKGFLSDAFFPMPSLPPRDWTKIPKGCEDASFGAWFNKAPLA
jgi:hypothetical protein